MARTSGPSGFSLVLDSRSWEELLHAGNYDWVAHYAQKILESKSATAFETQGDIEIVLLDSYSLPALSRAGYELPHPLDALRFGERYPQEQCSRPIIFPHEPWAGPHGPSFVLVLRTDENQVRGLSYAPYSGLLDDWWPVPRIAVRRSGGAGYRFPRRIV